MSSCVCGLVATYVGVGVSIAVGVGQQQHVDVHGVQEGGEGRVRAVVSGDLSKNTRKTGILKNRRSPLRDSLI